MADISCSQAASELLRQCVDGEQWDPDLVDLLTREQCSDPLFRILVEGLADRFEPGLCDDYAAIFSLVLEKALPDLRAYDLYARYQRVRRPRVCTIEPHRIVVLSRVTLGADVAVTSVILDALKRRFPQSEILLAGSRKAAELFAECSRTQHLEVPYPRSGNLVGRLASWPVISSLIGREDTMLIGREDTIVVDPDSRLTQLGLLPVCPENRYFFFESRAYEADTDASLTTLAQRWSAETFGQPEASNKIFPPLEEKPRAPYVTVSLGSGDNPSKQLPAPFEASLIRLLCSRFPEVIVDSGFGMEEAARVQHAIAGTSARTWTGSFARFASLISTSESYIGYDSAGQHAAAAFGTPLLTLFRGFASDRMFARWQPTGPGPKQILKIAHSISIEEVSSALDLLKKS